LVALTGSMRPDDPPEPLRPGIRRRTSLFDVPDATAVNPKFDLLRSTWSHYPALLTIGETYLALDRPDANFVQDFQTEGFDARLWELYLFAAFREQAIRVSQRHPSPDFHLERDGRTLFVEAVTANSEGSRIQPMTLPNPAPTDLDERTLGEPAVRFAKSLKSKMDRRYWELPHVIDQPFALAIGDFHQAGSMTWSLQALQSYLYGVRTVLEHDEKRTKRARAEPVTQLHSVQPIPAGLFRQPEARHLSAVIGSNAGTLTKFNRMGYLAGWKLPGLTMERSGIFFSHEGNRLEPKDFRFDLDDPTYQKLWPFGECWCLELEVYHNPQALHPIPREFFPGATHFFERDGEIVFEGPWENRVLASVTLLKQAPKR
jgi:hypothetical protein